MPKDEVRRWLDERCGRLVNVETRVSNDTAPPLLNEGTLSKQPSPTANASVYQVGGVSYNLHSGRRGCSHTKRASRAARNDL